MSNSRKVSRMHRLNHRTAGWTNPLPLVAVAIATVCIIAGVFIAWYLTNYRYVEIRTPDGRVVFADRVTEREAKKIREDELDKYEEQMAKVEAQKAAMEAAAEPKPTASRTIRTTDKPSPRGIKIRIAAHSDPKIRMTTNHRELSDEKRGELLGELLDEDRGMIAGHLLSKYTGTLRSVEIVAELFDTDEKKLKTLTTTRMNVLAGKPIGFVLVYDGVPAFDISTIVVDAVANQATRLDVAMEVAATDCEMNIDGTSVVITGRVRNTMPTALRQIEIHCDFTAAEGVYLGSARGRIEDSLTELAPGEWAFFTAKFNPSVVGRMSQAAEGFSVVLIGRK